MAGRATDPRTILLPFLGIGFGIAAYLMAGALAPGAGASPLPRLGVGTGVSPQLIGLGIVAAGASILAVWIGIRIVQGSHPATYSVLLGGIALVVAMLAAVLLLHAAPAVGAPPSASSAPATPSSGNTSLPPLPTAGASPPGIAAPWNGPPWIAYVLLVGMAGAIAVFAVLHGIVGRGRPSGPPHIGRSVPPTPLAAVRAARAALDERAPADPRAAIVALYGHLLAAIGDRTGPIDPKTARELSRDLVAGLGVSRGVADTLTARFEEARYSTRPIGPEQVESARAAIDQALRELSGRGIVA